MHTQDAYLWVRLGDAGNYSQHDELEEAIVHLREFGVGPVYGWMRNGFTAFGYEGYNYVSLYWGDAHADFLEPLSDEERKAVVYHLF